jgi:hypothetical protein
VFPSEIGFAEAFHHGVAGVVLFVVFGAHCFIEYAFGFVVAFPDALFGPRDLG